MHMKAQQYAVPLVLQLTCMFLNGTSVRRRTISTENSCNSVDKLQSMYPVKGFTLNCVHVAGVLIYSNPRGRFIDKYQSWAHMPIDAVDVPWYN